MIQIREVALVLCIFKSGNFFLAHPVDIQNAHKISRRISTGFQGILGERIPMKVAQGGVGGSSM